MSLTALAWITHRRPKLIQRSIETFAPVDQSLKRYVFEAGASTRSLATDFKVGAQPVNFSWLAQEQIRPWMNALKDRAKTQGIDPSLLDFALQAETESRSETLPYPQTGANRNTQLLMLVNQQFLSIDDDVLLPPVRQNQEQANLHSHAQDPLLTNFFRSQEELNQFRTTIPIEEFIRAHNELLNHQTDQFSATAVTMSGISGDSGCSTPRMLFTLTYDQIMRVTKTPGVFDAALRNRLIHRQVPQATLSPHPILMAPTMALNNELCLPPFFPFGRNQDGSFAYLLKACLPGTAIGHVPYCVVHKPEPQRFYESEVLTRFEFRMNDLLILLISDFLSPDTKNSNPSAIKNDLYENFGRHLMEISRIDSLSFLSVIRELYKKAILGRADRIEGRADELSQLKEAQSTDLNKWITAARFEVEISRSTPKRESFGIPVECFTENEDPMLCVDRTRKLLFKFGHLLKVWPHLRSLAFSL